MKLIAGLALTVILSIGIQAQPAPPNAYGSLDAVLWSQRSAEYRAIGTQTFQMARQSLHVALSQPNATAATEQEPPFHQLPPAIILDLDETVLDNTSFRVRLMKEGLPYSDALWQQWVDRVEALALPGAAAFLSHVQAQGVAAFYITNRVCNASSPTDPTVALLKKLNFAFAPARLLCRLADTDSSNKSPRRAKVTTTHRVLLMLGDDLNDFVAVPTAPGEWKDRSEARNGLVAAHADKWGSQWFLLPNPMYGSWERAIGETVPAKLDALRPESPK